MAETAEKGAVDRANLGADALLAVLREAQDTVRSYDTKAQIVGVGYILSLSVVRQSGDHIPVPVEYAVWYVLAGWIIIVLPIIMFAAVLYPSRIDRIARHPAPSGVLGGLYYNAKKFDGFEAYHDALTRADWVREVAYEIQKVSAIRDLKRVRFLRALYWTAGSFIMLFASQMLRASGWLAP